MKVVRSCLLLTALGIGTFAIALPALALEPIKLIPPDLSQGKPLMQVLKNRKSTKAFDTEPLPKETLSGLL